MSIVDLYELLQVHPKASIDVIKKAYHALMQKTHPDKGGDGELAKQLIQAYEVLTDPEKRLQYDRWRQKLEEQPPAIQKVPTQNLTGAWRAPILLGTQVLVADERGHRILVINQDGDIIWEYGKLKGEKLSHPTLASFLPNKHILVVDTGNQRVMEVTPQKEQIWSYGYNQVSSELQARYQPRFVAPTRAGHRLITDMGNQRLIEVDRNYQILWEYRGKAKLNLKLWNFLLRQEAFVPVMASELPNGALLVADQGNGRLYEIDRKGALHWIYPAQRHQQIQGLNFAQRLDNGHTWVVSDKILEVDQAGTVVWTYEQLLDVDIKQAYRLDEGSFIMDFVRLVRRGVNQEVMLLNHANKIIWRHYYSQHRCI